MIDDGPGFSAKVLSFSSSSLSFPSSSWLLLRSWLKNDPGFKFSDISYPMTLARSESTPNAAKMTQNNMKQNQQGVSSTYPCKVRIDQQNTSNLMLIIEVFVC